MLKSTTLIFILFLSMNTFASKKLPILKNVYITMINPIKSKQSGTITTTKIAVHTLYEGDNYTACVTPLRQFYIFPKSKNSDPINLGSPMELAIHERYFKNKRQAIRRKIISLEASAPSKNPESLTITSTLEEGAIHTLNIIFTPNSIEISNSVQDPTDLKPMTIASSTLRIPSATLQHENMNWESTKKALGKSSLQVKSPKIIKIPYTKDNPKLGVGTEFELKNYWSGRKIMIETIRGERTRPDLTLLVYGKIAPALNGFQFLLNPNLGDKITDSQNSIRKSDVLHPATIKITID
ncbi:hypothetical protein PQO03_17385 [Lentisphaera profundi]|uniref:DUF4139 domain-containing protein n=1 Tax=Lentisphaera profundi TaxID=1658616 RepID=A0ABY7W010_9BACT|nr:hypothetical protein [Lentisphaera profundi]WDE97603.1 hypothetical protein PQO03_17385 [Lentisphaera profundi]